MLAPSSPSGLRSRKLVREPIRSETNGNGYSTKTCSKPDQTSRIQFRHWLLILVIVASVYSFVVYVDNRMPEVLPSNQYVEFSETRARTFLKTLAGFGPRPSGSVACEVKAVNLIDDKLYEIKKVVDSIGSNRLEMDVQRPSGCFDLGFLSSFTLCYRNITNIIARFGPKSGPAPHSVLVNCHFDTLPDSPGATDDGVSCAIMLEILEVYARSKEPFENDIVLLFNGAEENFLQASHGFITNHPWRHSIRAFVNLEGAGAGGREMLFQAGPGNSWLLKTYLDNAPHPHCSILAQEIFQSGIVPSDTDFRMFRDYGRIPGLDIAYVRNGWVYHTEFDRPEFIPAGAIQRAGENTLAVVRALVKSPYLAHPGNYQEGRWVFYDIIGLFTVCYSLDLSVIINYVAVALVALKIFRNLVLKSNRYGENYTKGDLVMALFHQLAAMIVISATGLLLVYMVKSLDLIMVWYATPEIIFPLYFLPCLMAGVATHAVISQRYYKQRDPYVIEQAHYDSMLVIFATLLFVMTFMGWASAFLVFIHVIFPVLRDVIHAILVRCRMANERSATAILYAQLIAVLPVILFGCYGVMLVYEFFVPIMGRIGNAFNPEFMVMPISVLATFSFVLYTNNLLYISRSIWYLLKCGLALFILFIVVLLTTRLGEPYKYSPDAPRLRRVIILHTKRTIYDFSGAVQKSDNGLFVQALDYRGTKDLPEHTFLQGSRVPDCSKTSDEFCQLPYYTAIHELFPPEESRWVSLPTTPPIERPLQLELVERSQPAKNQVNISFWVDGGTDKTSLHVTPINGYKMVQWSLTSTGLRDMADRRTYFAFICYGKYSGPWNFWVLLEHSDPNPPDPKKQPSLELAVATHYAHGPYQYSETIQQVRSLINSRRTTPHMAVGWWKWAMTHICGASELVAKFF
uniref:FXNA-like protease n=1 Tax=Plectus sambesii TaxID=2011161 RepID=A0A914VXQ3_9BILA